MKPAACIVALLLTLVAIGHLLRLLFHVEVVISGWVVPTWVSVPGIVVPLALAIGLWREGRGQVSGSGPGA